MTFQIYPDIKQEERKKKPSCSEDKRNGTMSSEEREREFCVARVSFVYLFQRRNSAALSSTVVDVVVIIVCVCVFVVVRTPCFLRERV